MDTGTASNALSGSLAIAGTGVVGDAARSTRALSGATLVTFDCGAGTATRRLRSAAGASTDAAVEFEGVAAAMAVTAGLADADVGFGVGASSGMAVVLGVEVSTGVIGVTTSLVVVSSAAGAVGVSGNTVGLDVGEVVEPVDV